MTLSETGMKRRWIVGTVVIALLRAAGGGAAVRAEAPDAGNATIYHDGWIDLNKNGVRDVYEDAAQPLDARIDDLLPRMNVAEKTMQMATLYGFPRVLKDELPDRAKWATKLWRDGIGNIDEHANGNTNYGRPIEDPATDLPLAAHAGTMNSLQRYFIEETRLGIPADFTNEGVRGLLHSHATSFPSPLGLAAAWNLDLARRAGEVTAREARALGYTHIYAPILDLPRDPRWGRTCECFSEDPFLTGELGVALAEGLLAGGVGATCKHFAVYGIPAGGRDGAARTDPQATWQDVYALHLHPFRAVMTRARPTGVMASYNDYGGTPLAANATFLTEILRRRWGFEGYVVSDSGAVEDLDQKHQVAADRRASVRLAVEAGLNVRTHFTTPDDFVRPLRALIADGQLPLETIDARVRDVLRVKFRLGLFDRPYVADPEAAEVVVRSAAHRAVAEQAARESLVLLKNEAGALPLAKSTRRILVTGPLADNPGAWWDRYGPQRIDYVTPLEGIRAKLGTAADVLYAPGCPVVDARYPLSDVYREAADAATAAQIRDAAAQAKTVDVVIAVLGEDGEISREDRSRVSLDLPGHQDDLLRALHATGTPVILVLSSGRPLSVNWAHDHLPAVVEMWFSNEQGGTALAEMLFGDVNPSGKLPITFPRTVGQIPLAFPYKPAAQALDGGQVTGPLYPFGHGLSYTSFRYDHLEIRPEGDNWTVTATVTNTGKRAGVEIAQLYVRDDVSSVTTFERTLQGFQRVEVAPGESKSVSFALQRSALGFWDNAGRYRIEPGTFTIWVGASSADLRLEGKLTLAPAGDAGQTADADDFERR